MSPGERPPELVGTWRVVRWEDRDSADEAWTSPFESRGSSTPAAMGCADRPFVIEGDSFVLGDGTTWVRATERVR